MSIKIRLEPKKEMTDAMLLRKMMREAKKTKTPEKEITLDEVIYGEERELDELIP